MRLIDGDALYKDVCRVYDECGDILEIIDKQPTIEPSAQPEEIALHESCSDCPLYDKDRHSCPRFNKVIPEVLREAQPEQRWIPCSETVDIPDHEVLACDKYGEEILGYLEYADEQWICASEDCVMYDPIAWMEKPEPYTERRQE